MHGKRHMRLKAALLASVALGLATVAPARSEGPAALLPPDLDYATHCAPVAAAEARQPLDRDWTTWQGEPVALPARQLQDIATEYLRGSDRVEASPDTALKILRWLEAQPNADRSRLDRMIGRILVEAGRTAEEMAEGETRLARALSSGEPRAALDLATLYGPNGPQALRNPDKARALAQTAAAWGSADGKLLYASILNGDPNVPPEQKSFATDAALLAMIGEIVNGDCSHLDTIGLVYMRGTLVPEDIPVAIEWFKQSAETGNARTQERLGDLIAGPRLETNDFPLAMDYYEKAADQGRPAAALKVGQDYATGLVRPRNLDKARHYLGIAAATGSRDGNLWLARLSYGNFGGAPDWAEAHRYYRAALEAGSFDAELASEFGIALMDNSSGPADLAEAKSLLTEAALSGSGIAAVKVGEILLDEARTTPALYHEVETWMRLGDSLGRSEAARHMAELSLCAGPLFNPSAVPEWNARGLALGADAMILDEGRGLIGSSDASEHAQGVALIRQVAIDGDPRAVGYALANLRSGQGALGADPDLLARLETYVAGNGNDPAFTRDFDLAYVTAELDLPDGDTRLDAALATLDAYIAKGDGDATLLKAALLREHGNAPAAELIPLYQTAADAGVVKSMRELGNAMLDDPGADIETARTWLQKAATGGDVKAALRLLDTTAETAPATLKAIGESGTICSVDTMVTLAKTWSVAIDPSAYPEAAHWLATATQVAGNRASELVRIASAYQGGTAGREAVAEAEPLLARAVQLGDKEAAIKLAEGHLEGDWPDADPDSAHQLLAGLAADGDAVAAASLLEAISEGDIEAPAAEVVRLAEQSRAELDDNGQTLSRLARLDEQGAFGSPDSTRQMGWLQAAADAGDATAMMRLYRSYASGIGVPASPGEAIAWLQKAADIGDRRAANELAAAYTVGFGTQADPEQAAFWRARAQVN